MLVLLICEKDCSTQGTSKGTSKSVVHGDGELVKQVPDITNDMGVNKFQAAGVKILDVEQKLSNCLLSSGVRRGLGEGLLCCNVSFCLQI